MSAYHPRTGIYEEGVRELVSKLGEAGAIVSYGAASGGLRASEQIRQVLAEFRTHITGNSLAISGASQKTDDEGLWVGADDKNPAFKSVVDELYWWASALKTARETAPYPS